MPVKERRQRRLLRTRAISDQRLREHKIWHHPAGALVRCYCRMESWSFWSKRQPHGCSCSKRTRGAPRRDRGMCCLADRTRIYRWRGEVRELRAEARAGRYNPHAG